VTLFLACSYPSALKISLSAATDEPALIAAAVHDHVASEVDCAALPWAPEHAGDRAL
jgi:hypothetical protein